MTKLNMTLLMLAILSLGEGARACDMKLTIRPHADRIVFGDPLYVEVTLTNEGDEPVAGPTPLLLFNTLGFTISEPRGQLSYRTIGGGGMVGGVGLRVFEPGAPVKYYVTLMLPRYHEFDHVFWERYRGGGSVSVQAVYRPIVGGVVIGNASDDVPLVGARRPITSSSHEVYLHARAESQVDVLRHWNDREIKREDYKKGPVPSNFHVPVDVANREEMAEFASQAGLSGELRDLVDLSLRFRDLYELPPDSREEGNRELVEWLRKAPNALHHFGAPESMVSNAVRGVLRKETTRDHSDSYYLFLGAEGGIERVRYYPEVKRQVLARELRSVAAGYNMLSTFESLGGENPQSPQFVPEGGIWPEETLGTE